MCVNFTPIKKERLKAPTGVELDDYPSEAYPGYQAPMIVLDESAQTRVELAVFGLIPHWAKDRSFAKRTYNARSETVAEKPSYRQAWKRRQFCLIPMERFYEPNWTSGKAVRWAIERQDHEPFSVAGIWDRWTDKTSGEVVQSFSMLTINADGHPIMGQFHKPGDEKRSLVIVPPSSRKDWLSATADNAFDLMRELPTQEFTSRADPK
ncbi:SOS response-associated peptidase (plasmid) [Ampullimonas aquatilis]|uniref:SOS response-associated peptidase n=1 Tax=Ampullimonas aquatilis TaxID=1341549 RepID=UPI003C726735